MPLQNEEFTGRLRYFQGKLQQEVRRWEVSVPLHSWIAWVDVEGECY